MKDLGIEIPGEKLNGLIPGILGDIVDISTTPIEILDVLLGNSKDSFQCSLKGKKTGPSNNLKWEFKCSPPNKEKTCIPEAFQSKNMIESESKKDNFLSYIFIVIVIVFLVLGLIFIWKSSNTF